jgi:hypothetical protein
MIAINLVKHGSLSKNITRRLSAPIAVHYTMSFQIKSKKNLKHSPIKALNYRRAARGENEDNRGSSILKNSFIAHLSSPILKRSVQFL